MVRSSVIQLLNLIQRNTGLEKDDVCNKPDVDLQKIINIILSECKCSITDSQGDYVRFGSSIDIRIVLNLIKVFLSDLKSISPEVVCMALTSEQIIGPFTPINFEKKYDKENNSYEIEMNELFPKEFNADFFERNLEIRNLFIDDILKPYVKNLIFENDILMNKSPIGAWISKKTSIKKETEDLEKDLKNILKKALKCDEKLIENIASYIVVNIMGNRAFKEELKNKAINATELQKLGKIYTGFNGLVENMVSEAMRTIELKEIPFREIDDIEDIFYTTIAVLNTLSISFEGLSDIEIITKMFDINTKYNISSQNKQNIKCEYRKKNINVDKYGNIIEFVPAKDIPRAMDNLCKMIRVLLSKKNEVGMEKYVEEVLRIHYRFLRIQPFEQNNEKVARALVNILLQSKEMIGIFRKEKRKEYEESIRTAHKSIKSNEMKYIEGLIYNPMNCVELEDEFLRKKLPFLLIKY